MNKDNAFDWIGLIIVLFFLLLPLLSTLLKKRAPVKKRPPPKPIQTPVFKPKKEVIKPPPVFMAKKRAPVKKTPIIQKKITTRYGSIKNGIILSEILKRPYWD